MRPTRQLLLRLPLLPTTPDYRIDYEAADPALLVQLAEHAKSADMLDVAKFPTATYKSTKVNFDGDKVVSVEGNLTLKGVTKPVTLSVVSFQCMPHPMVKKDACGATATAKVKRTDFNMGKYAPYVGDEVTITLPVEAYKP